MTPKQEILKLAKQTNNMPTLMLACYILQNQKHPFCNKHIIIPEKVNNKSINMLYQYVKQTNNPEETKQNFIHLMNNWKEFKRNAL